MDNGLRNAIQAEMQCRSGRYKTIPADLLGEPVWDILLDLAMSFLGGERIQITAVGLTAGLAPTTALRWICRLEERGLIRRVPDEDDGRRTWLEILPGTMTRLAECFGYEWPPQKKKSLAAPSEGKGDSGKGIFFTGPADHQRRLQDQLQPIETDDDVRGNNRGRKSGPKALLLKRATDWVNQDYDERLSFAAQALYVHGYLSPQEYRRIEMEVRDDAEKARDDKVRARREKLW